jgi:rSAM-partnered protein
MTDARPADDNQSAGDSPPATDREWHHVEAPRADESREWEVFLRETDTEPLRHAGSVSAPSENLAHEQATSLFDHAANTIWLCPSDETHRLTRDPLAEDTDDPEMAGEDR